MLNSMKEPIVYTTGSYMKIPKIGQTKHSHIFVDDTENSPFGLVFVFGLFLYQRKGLFLW